MIAECGRHDVRVNFIQDHCGLDMPIVKLPDFPSYGPAQAGMFGNAAAQHNPLRGVGVDQVGQREGDVLRFQVPGGMIVRERFSALATAFFHGEAGGQPFEAIPMERANAREWVLFPVVRYEDVSDFGVYQPVNWSAISEYPNPYPGSDGHIYKRVQGFVLQCPVMFTESSGIDVGIECNRPVQGPLDAAAQIHLTPVWLGCGCDIAVRGGGVIYVNG